KLAPSGKTTSDVGVDLITGFEGTRFKAYDDGVGVWTIGTGTTVYPNGVKVKKGDTCTAEQAKTYFKHDLAKFEKAVNESVTVPLTQNQFDALVSLTYNIGSGAFKSSNLLKLLNKGDYQGAADQLLRWNKAKGKVLNGLVRRREAERTLFLKK
ncbi:lysozyme, partial [Acinetobacter pittii]|uniref:lysozyme n=1 Tax=Acinetobacter pittii TaxID=48296 RepID=UPI00300AF5BE